MKNKLEDSWNEYKGKVSNTMTYRHRDRCNFKAGFNAAFKLFGKEQEMTLQKFQEEVESILIEYGYTITLECTGGLWIITVFSKVNGSQLASTGATGLSGVAKALKTPFNMCPWK